MKKLAIIVMIAIFTMAIAVPAFGCGGDKGASKDCSATCAGKASCDKQGMSAKECAAKCEAMKKDGMSCPSKPGCVCPSGMGTAIKKTGASNDNRMQIMSAVATPDTKISVNLTGESGCPMMSKSADAKAGDHSCTAAERAKCGIDKKEGASTAKLPNGHPVQTVADAMKCESGSMVAFLAVDKMTCQGCVDHVSKTLGSIDGVCAVDVNLKKASATVVFHNDKVKTDEMITAINKAGYVASMKTECTDDMKALFGDNYKDKCQKSCANTCKGKAGSKNSES
jgi:copper ion binding protein